eukprot:GFUD01033135.1.p1 GENE.GFUD01033135.1~~GFUD01033135.1.p1  ORF type:complete len:559 (-),score=202.78 GFUD01033135.1:889-2565(-)
MSGSSVILFKTGYSFISQPVQLGQGEEGKEGAVEECRIGPLPAFAVHGTVAVQAWNTDQVEVLSLGRRKKEDLELSLPTEDMSMAGFLEANMGTMVSVDVEEGQGMRAGTRCYQGRVKWVKAMGDEGTEARLAMLEIKEGQVKKDKLFNCSNIVNIEKIAEDEEEVSLVARYRRTATSKAPMATLSYLTRGLAWAPSYSLLINKEEMTLRLDGHATFLCDLPQFDGEPVGCVSLVAERPKVHLEQLCDPLVSGMGAMDFIRQLGAETGQHVPQRHVLKPPGAQYEQHSRSKKSSNVMMGGCSGRGYEMEMEESYVSQSVEGIKGGESVEDFFHYQLQSVPLNHKQPVKMPFIKQCGDIKYEDIYFIDLDNNVRIASSGEDEESSVEVKHAISFKNSSGQPLTSAPVSILAREKEEGQSKFMVQGMMKFTGPGKPVIVEITRSKDVQANYVVETGSDRKTELISKAVSWTGAGKKYVDIISKKGKLTIKNPRKTQINCKIEHALQGHLEKSNPVVKEVTERQSGNHGELNHISKLLWELSVPAEGTAELSIEYGIKVWK